MAKVYEGIPARLADWVHEQPMFFVATAPLAGDGMVNVSVKGTKGTFRVLDEHTFAYVDLTGSGAETVAHLRENGRICVMFVSFDARPDIVRFHGTGSVAFPGDPGFDERLAWFGEAGTGRRDPARAVITVDVARVADACGYAVPLMEFAGERDLLDSWSDRRSPGALAAYRTRKNATSLDGLPAVPVAGADRPGLAESAAGRAGCATVDDLGDDRRHPAPADEQDRERDEGDERERQRQPAGERRAQQQPDDDRSGEHGAARDETGGPGPHPRCRPGDAEPDHERCGRGQDAADPARLLVTGAADGGEHQDRDDVGGEGQGGDAGRADGGHEPRVGGAVGGPDDPGHPAHRAK